MSLRIRVHCRDYSSFNFDHGVALYSKYAAREQCEHGDNDAYNRDDRYVYVCLKCFEVIGVFSPGPRLFENNIEHFGLAFNSVNVLFICMIKVAVSNERKSLYVQMLQVHLEHMM